MPKIHCDIAEFFIVLVQWEFFSKFDEIFLQRIKLSKYIGNRAPSRLLRALLSRKSLQSSIKLPKDHPGLTLQRSITLNQQKCQ